MKYPEIYAYTRLMRLDKPIGSFLLLWPTLMALWIAGEGRPSPYIVAIFVIGVFVMRTAGCVINDLLDRRIDRAVTRTKMRPLAAGELKPKSALMLFAILLLLAFGLVLQLNFLTFKLAVIALMLVVIYPLMKRYTHFPQVVLGMAYGCAVLMAFSALKNAIPLQAWWLYGATICWAIAYDTEYAMVDRADDIKIGVKSTVIWFGKRDRLAVGIFHCVALSLLGKLGLDLGLGLWYFVGISSAGVLACYQQYLIRDRKREHCFKAFLNNNWFGMALFMGLFLDYCC